MACHSESGLLLDPGVTEEDIAIAEVDRLAAAVNVVEGRQRDVRVARAACRSITDIRHLARDRVR
jgi:hypothetical protein